MSLGILCLLADDAAEAMTMAQKLHELNLARRSIEADMQDAAQIALEDIDTGDRYSLCLYQPEWHQGVIGILASRIKEHYHRPVIAFAQAGDGILKGSGRSISGLHLRDALDLLSKRHPGLILKFGGHAMAAGLSITEDSYEVFDRAFEEVVTSLLTPADLQSVIEVDGELDGSDIHWEMAVTIERQVWGQGFPQPAFCDAFQVVSQRVVGERHLKMTLSKHGRHFEAIFFGQQDFLPEEIVAVYQLQTNQYQGMQAVQLCLKHWHPAIG
jgi:single-stranded-DNA-specific exonuclease